MKQFGKIDLKAKLQKFYRARQSALRAIANNSVNFFKVNVFEAQGFIDVTVSRWAPKKKPEPSRKILVKTGHGRQSIHVKSIIGTKITIEAEAYYMKYHNEGTKNLPKRQFMGNSDTLNKQNIRIFKQKMKRVL